MAEPTPTPPRSKYLDEASPTPTKTPQPTATPAPSSFVRQFPDKKWYVVDANLNPISAGFSTQAIATTEAMKMDREGKLRGGPPAAGTPVPGAAPAAAPASAGNYGPKSGDIYTPETGEVDYRTPAPYTPGGATARTGGGGAAGAAGATAAPAKPKPIRYGLFNGVPSWVVDTGKRDAEGKTIWAQAPEPPMPGNASPVEGKPTFWAPEAGVGYRLFSWDVDEQTFLPTERTETQPQTIDRTPRGLAMDNAPAGRDLTPQQVLESSGENAPLTRGFESTGSIGGGATNIVPLDSAPHIPGLFTGREEEPTSQFGAASQGGNVGLVPHAMGGGGYASFTSPQGGLGQNIRNVLNDWGQPVTGDPVKDSRAHAALMELIASRARSGGDPTALRTELMSANRGGGMVPGMMAPENNDVQTVSQRPGGAWTARSRNVSPTSLHIQRQNTGPEPLYVDPFTGQAIYAGMADDEQHASYAQGGVINEPRILVNPQTGNATGMVGEQGPEMVEPLFDPFMNAVAEPTSWGQTGFDAEGYGGMDRVRTTQDSVNRFHNLKRRQMEASRLQAAGAIAPPQMLGSSGKVAPVAPQPAPLPKPTTAAGGYGPGGRNYRDPISTARRYGEGMAG